jgi:hypothetical protein
MAQKNVTSIMPALLAQRVQPQVNITNQGEHIIKKMGQVAHQQTSHRFVGVVRVEKCVDLLVVEMQMIPVTIQVHQSLQHVKVPQQHVRRMDYFVGLGLTNVAQIIMNVNTMVMAQLGKAVAFKKQMPVELQQGFALAHLIRVQLMNVN